MSEVAPPRSSITHPSSWPIAVKLGLVLITVSLLPMIVTVVLDVWQAKDAARAAEHDHLRRLAASGAGRLGQLLTDTGRVAAQVAGDAEVIEYLGGDGSAARAAAQASASQTLANVTRSNADIATVFLLDASGTCVLSTRAEEVGVDFRRRPYYVQAVSGGSYVSEILAGVTTKKPGVYLANAVKAARGVVGVAVLKLSGEVVTHMVNDVHPTPGGAFLVDPYGVVVAGSDPAILYKSLAPIRPEVAALPEFEQRFSAVGVDKIESLRLDALAGVMIGAEKSGSSTYPLPEGGDPELVGYAPVGSKQWTLAVHEPEAKMNKPFAAVLRHALANALLVGGLVMIIAFFLARSIVRPLRRLTSAAQAVRRGSFSEASKLEVGSDDEIGALSDSFKRMAHGLAERERELEIFGRLVSPEVRETLLDGNLKLGGETRWAAVLFSDIRGFSTLSENMDPQAVVALLNEYLTEMTKAAAPFHGYVNNFIGDAIVVIFGAPVPAPDAEWRAVMAALAMRDALAALNVRRTARGDDPLETGIGIAAGDLVAGQIGSPERMLYTVIGDVVNVAARLESLTKDYPGKSILVTDRIARALDDKPVAAHSEPLGPIRLKGRTAPVDVFAVVR